MDKNQERDKLEALCRYDTPSVTNVVAAYPGRPHCLGLFNPWTTNWYTDDSIRCMFPELGSLAGYAVTCVYGLPDPGFPGISLMDLIEVLDASAKPTVLVVQQRFPPELRHKVGLLGGNMTNAMKAVGCVGAVSNGPSRDVDEVRELGFQYLIPGLSAGHGDMHMHAVNVPVSVGGMDVSPGDIVHMDGNGACRFPADALTAVLEKLPLLEQEEERRIAALRKAHTAREVRAIFEGKTYGD